jgi:hypothetical protein
VTAEGTPMKIAVNLEQIRQYLAKHGGAAA